MFKQGKQKTGGRKPGSKNKKTILFQGKIEECGNEALSVMLELLKDKNKHYRYLASKEIMKYTFPTKKESNFEVKEQIDKEKLKEELNILFGFNTN